MKNILTTILFTLVLSANLQAATLVVNNLNPIQGQYATLQAAVDAAASGDVILIYGSSKDYGTVEIPATKALTLRGPGWNTIYRQTNVSASINEIWLAATAHDITIEGLVFSTLQMRYGAFDVPSNRNIYDQYNVTVQFCQFNSIYLNDRSSNVSIKNNYCDGIIDGANKVTSNIIVEHNILKYLDNMWHSVNAIIDHNLFLGGALRGIMTDVVFSNNIFYYSAVNNDAMNSCVFSNNLTYYPDIPIIAHFYVSGTSSNIHNTVNYTGADLQNVDPLFVSAITQAYNAQLDYHLQANSPCKNAGTDGSDLGIYGNGYRFSKTGEPETPAVRSLIINNPVVQSGNNLNFKITASKARADGN